MRRRTVAATAVGAIVVLAVLIAGAVFMITQTDWGRKKVGDYVIGLIRHAAHGYVTVDRIDGNLLNGATIIGLTITDSAHAPFVKVDTVVATYGIRDLINKRIYLGDVRLVHPVIVLDRMPGGKWNYDRIFPRDTTQPPGPPGFLSWITLRNVTAVDGEITARSPWTPSDTLKGSIRDSVIRFTLSPLARLNVQRVAGGFQKTSQFVAAHDRGAIATASSAGDRREGTFHRSRRFVVLQRYQCDACKLAALEGHGTLQFRHQ
jgi:translocation and assembly module TamB